MDVVFLLLGLAVWIAATAGIIGVVFGLSRLIGLVQDWRTFRRWVEYRSQGERELFPATRLCPQHDANLEMRINRLARSHTEPLARRIELLELRARVGDGLGQRQEPRS